MRVLDYARDAVEVSVAPDLSAGLPSGSALDAGDWNYAVKQWDKARVRQLTRSALAHWHAFTPGFDLTNANTTGLFLPVGVNKIAAALDLGATRVIREYNLNDLSYSDAYSTTNATLSLFAYFPGLGYLHSKTGSPSGLAINGTNTCLEGTWNASTIQDYRAFNHPRIQFLFSESGDGTNQVWAAESLDGEPFLIDSFPIAQGEDFVNIDFSQAQLYPEMGLVVCSTNQSISGVTYVYSGTGASKGSFKATEMQHGLLRCSAVAGGFFFSGLSFDGSDTVTPLQFFGDAAQDPATWIEAPALTSAQLWQDGGGGPELDGRIAIAVTVDGLSYDLFSLGRIVHPNQDAIVYDYYTRYQGRRVWFCSDTNTPGTFDKWFYSDVFPDVPLAVI